MLDILLLATMLVVCGGIGLPLAFLLPERFEWRPLVAPMLGIAVISVLAPVAYHWGVPVPIFFDVLVVLAFAGVVFHARRLAAAARTTPNLWLIAGAWLACTLLLLAPCWVGGEQFAVFQGNPWDTFAYLESAVSYARKPYAAMRAVTESQIARFPLLSIGQEQLDQRPSVHLLYATFSRVAPGEAYRLYYTFLVFFFSQFFLVALFGLRTLLRAAPLWALLAISAVFPLGFWGQWVLDINAWSQIAATPLLLLMFVLLIAAAHGETSPRLVIVTAVVVAGAVYLYPEGFIIYAAALFPLAGALPLWRMIRTRSFEPRAWLPLASIGGVVTSVLYPPTVHFLIQQVTFGSRAKVPWWEFFQGFFAGRDAAWGDGIAQKIDFAAGLSGLYFATPASDGVTAVIQRAAIAITIGALLAALSWIIARRRAPLGAWAIATAVMLLPALYLFHGDNYWAAGKVLSYAAPVLVTLLAMPMAFELPGALKPLRWITIAFVAFQIANGALRVAAARDPDGIHYAPPYPAVAAPAIKKEIGWNLSGLEPYLDEQTHVIIKPTHQWLEQGLHVFLFSRRIPYARPGIVNTYFGDGRNLESPVPGWQPDVEISVDGKAFVLHFTNGRPDVRVVSGADLR